jgi:glutaredoxin
VKGSSAPFLPWSIRLIIHCALQLVLLASLLGGVPADVRSVPSPAADLEVFVLDGCSHCEDAKRFLVELRRDRPNLRIIVRDIDRDPTASTRLSELAAQFHHGRLGVPAFYLRGQLIIGYRGPDSTGQRLRALLDGALSTPQTAIEQVPDSVDVPFLGRVSPRNAGLPTFTIVMGLLDGFNPCAMWVLMFLLALLVNLRDRRKMAVVAGVFVLTSGLMYFVVMAAWLNVYLWIGRSQAIEWLVAGIAITVGSIHIKDFVAFGRGVSLSIPTGAKPLLFDRVRRLLEAQHLAGSLLAVATLAVLVNLIELLCTAGLPAVYTHILTLYGLPAWEYYAYLALYNAAYLADDILIVVIGVVTLSQRRLQERGGRWLKLLSGLVLLALGVLLLVKPGWMM